MLAQLRIILAIKGSGHSEHLLQLAAEEHPIRVVIAAPTREDHSLAQHFRDIVTKLENTYA